MNNLENAFNQYFNLFPEEYLNDNNIGFDAGCGSGNAKRDLDSGVRSGADVSQKVPQKPTKRCPRSRQGYLMWNYNDPRFFLYISMIIENQ